MRILFTIPHFCAGPETNASPRRHASSRNPDARLRALTSCVGAIYQTYGSAQLVMQIGLRRTEVANRGLTADVRVIICTSGEQHLLDRLSLPRDMFEHYPSHTEPKMLGFECQSILRERLAEYDYFCYLEDDLILHDPWFFLKLSWFNGHVGNDKLLLPNRFERGTGPLAYRAYVDGDLRRHVTARFQDVDERPRLESQLMGVPLVFRRPLNPHSGCYFLNAGQMQHWTREPSFLDRDTSFVGPLESAATLGIMRAFKIYKPARENANFLEIEHYGSRFLRLIRQRDATKD